MGPIQQVELKSERFAMAYRLLSAYAFVLPGSSKTAHTRIRNIGPTTISFRNNDQLLPPHDRVVIERNDAESKTFPTPPRRSRSGARSSPLDPAAGDETGKLIPIDVRVGDRVLFGKRSGTEVKIDVVEYLIMKESDIMGVLVEVEAKKKAA